MDKIWFWNIFCKYANWKSINEAERTQKFNGKKAGSNLGRNTTYADWGTSMFSPGSPRKFQDRNLISPPALILKSFPVKRPPTNPPPTLHVLRYWRHKLIHRLTGWHCTEEGSNVSFPEKCGSLRVLFFYKLNIYNSTGEPSNLI